MDDGLAAPRTKLGKLVPGASVPADADPTNGGRTSHINSALKRPTDLQVITFSEGRHHKWDTLLFNFPFKDQRLSEWFAAEAGHSAH